MLLAGGSESELRRAVDERTDDERADEALRVRVVAPARVGPLHWLTTDEDDARREAEVRALSAEWTLLGRARVDAQAGDADPVLAAADALSRFAADEILLVGGAGANGVLERALCRFELPVTRSGGAPATARAPRLEEAARAVAGGRSRATPFVLFARVDLVLLAFGALLAGAVALALWLAS